MHKIKETAMQCVQSYNILRLVYAQSTPRLTQEPQAVKEIATELAR